MKRNEAFVLNVVGPWAAPLLHTFPAILLVLSLGIGSFLSAGCVVVPAVMMTSATVTAAAVVSEGEKLVQNSDTENSITARNETAVPTRGGKACHRQGASLEEDPSGANTRQAAGNQCSAGLNEQKGGSDTTRPKT